MKTRLTALLLLFALLFTAAGCKGGEKAEEAEEINSTPVVESRDLKITVSMLTYYFNSIYNSFCDTNRAQLDSLGLDTGKSLKEQRYSEDYTWYNYFMGKAVKSSQQVLLLAQAAKENGIELEERDLAQIEAELDELSESAKVMDMPTEIFIKSIYGDTVNKTTVRKCLELSALSKKYSYSLSDSYTFTNEDYDRYFSENKEKLLRFSYIYFKNSYGEAELAAAEEAFLQCKTEDEFTALIKAHLQAKAPEGDAEYAEKELLKCYVSGAAYSDTSDFAKWAFEDGRAPYDVFTKALSDGTLLAAMLLPAESEAWSSVLSRDITPCRNIKSVLISEEDAGGTDKAKKKAEELYGEWKKDGSSDAFDRLIEENGGGLANDILPGSLGDALASWIFDGARKAGDTTVISVGGTGSYIIMYQGEGLPAWKQTAKAAMIEERYDKDVAELDKEYPLTYNNTDLTNLSQASGI